MATPRGITGTGQGWRRGSRSSGLLEPTGRAREDEVRHGGALGEVGTISGEAVLGEALGGELRRVRAGRRADEEGIREREEKTDHWIFFSVAEKYN